MSKKEFADFISRHKPAMEEEPIDWEAEKKEWLLYLDNLYNIVGSFLKQYTNRGQITVTYGDIELTEENIGRYKARTMMLAFGSNRLTLTPIGTLLIGTKGRVDMTGPKGIARLILVDKNNPKIIMISKVLGRGAAPTAPPFSKERRMPEWEWKIVVTRVPQLTYQSLTEESFFDAIMEISNA